MNSVFMIGRLVATPELRYNTSNKAYARFKVAVNRNFKNQDGKNVADFINCVAWEKVAENLCKFCHKGSLIAVVGRIQTGKFTKEDGTTGYTTDVVAKEITFLESKSKDERPEPEYTGYDVPQETSEEDPFSNFGENVSIDDNTFLD